MKAPIRFTLLMLLGLFGAGCCTKTVVDRPYADVRTALLKFEQQIDSQKRAPTDAEATNREITSGHKCELYIVERVEKPCHPYTKLTATASATNSTSIKVSSRQMGLIIDPRQPETEKRRLQELLEILR